MRLFVAMYPPMEAVREMLSLLGSLTLPGHRETPEAQVHLTLFFVGDTDPRQLGGVVESVRRSASGIGGIVLRPLRLVTLPARGGPRLVAMETDAPANLVELQRRLAHRLSRRGARGGEGFVPHLTLCRYSKEGGESISRAVEMPPFGVNDVTVVASVLKSSGAEHREVERVSLA
jgi:2'-5' RNA ligase